MTGTGSPTDRPTDPPLEAATAPVTDDAPPATRAGAALHRALRHPLAGLGAGAAICGGLPPWGWWPLPLLGIAWWLWLLDGRRARVRFLVGALVGVTWFTPSLLWMWRFSVPGYAAVLVVFTLGLGLVSVLATGTRARFLLLPALLVLTEWLRWHAPFGGAPVSVLPMTQVGGPLLPLARLGGPLLVTLVAASIGAALAAAPRFPRWSAGAAAVLVALTLVSIPAPDGHPDGRITIAAVQGGGPQATRFSRDQAEPVFRRHLDATEQVPDGVDVVLWPENVVNVDGTFENHPWRAEIGRMADRKGAPIIIGGVEEVLVPEYDPDAFRNFSQVVEPGGDLGDRYDKQRRVPFGEYVPLRGWFEPIAGGALPRRDQIPGDGPPVVEAADVPFGVMISWEVFFNRIARDGVTEGGQVLLNPTNGSSYWLTMVQTQQIASSRLRAVETGRYLVQAAPTGFSAIVNPAGDVMQRSAVGEQRVLVDTIERRKGRTVATLTGDWLALAPAFLLMVVGFAVWRRSARRPGTPSAQDGPPPPRA